MLFLVVFCLSGVVATLVVEVCRGSPECAISRIIRSITMNDAVQQIKDRLNIVDVIQTYIEVQKAGRNYKAKCPFHNEKTPSFHISPERGSYYCFGCHAGGDMFSFVQEIEHIDFKEALKVLAAKAGVELVPVSKEKKTATDRAFDALDQATSFFQEQLADGSEAKNYLLKRGVTEQTIMVWRLGFAPGPPFGGWRETKEYLSKQGFTDEEIFKVGLIKKTDNGKEPYDVFRNRVMFPIFNNSSHPIAFSGRTLEKRDDIPKYVNSPETEFFKKSEVLYGFHLAKQGIRQLDFSLIVEGQFDVVMSHQMGYHNAVAVSGTALTVEHIKLLERLSNRIVLALDADPAGVKAVKRAADLMLRRGLDVKVAVLPDGQDPADIILENPKNFKQIIGQSVHIIEFLCQTLQKQKLPERTFKLKAREEVLPYIVLLPNRIDQDYFETKVAEYLDTTKDAVHFEVERLRTVVKPEVAGEDISKPTLPNAKDKTADRFKIDLIFLCSLRSLLDDTKKAKLEKTMTEITASDFAELLAIVDQKRIEEMTFKVEANLEKAPKNWLRDETIFALNQFKNSFLKKELNLLKKKLQDAEANQEVEEVEKLTTLVTNLYQKRQEEAFVEDFLE